MREGKLCGPRKANGIKAAGDSEFTTRHTTTHSRGTRVDPSHYWYRSRLWIFTLVDSKDNDLQIKAKQKHTGIDVGKGADPKPLFSSY